MLIIGAAVNCWIVGRRKDPSSAGSRFDSRIQWIIDCFLRPCLPLFLLDVFVVKETAEERSLFSPSSSIELDSGGMLNGAHPSRDGSDASTILFCSPPHSFSARKQDQNRLQWISLDAETAPVSWIIRPESGMYKAWRMKRVEEEEEEEEEEKC